MTDYIKAAAEWEELTHKHAQTWGTMQTSAFPRGAAEGKAFPWEQQGRVQGS